MARLVASMLAAALLAVAAAGPAEARPRTWHVRAGEDPGRGTRSAPFGELSVVERMSRPGDRIVVLPAPRSAGTLDGGIRLKPRQVLVGGGPSVARGEVPDAAPRITNTDSSRLDGDAVRLASGAFVRNLVIEGARRGGIYGLNVTRATITGNDVSGHNTSCTRGFHIPPFNVPTTAPGVGVPISEGLHNGWAGIMVDAERRPSKVNITGNRVHDADCGDGIDLRASGTGRIQTRIARNDVRELRQGEDLESILAIGLQTRDSARLVARLVDNRQSGLGNDEDLGLFGPTGADTEGVFINPVGPSSMRVAVAGNLYTHARGRGGFSSNGLEFVSMGDGPRALVEVVDSSFVGTPGDVLEQLALGTNARLRMRLDRVTASRSTGLADSGHGDTLVIPGNNGDCLISASGGAGNLVDVRVRESTLTDCANNGFTLGSAVANGDGPTNELRAEVTDTRITGNRGGNLRIGNLSALDRLIVKVERTDLSHSQGSTSTPANLTVQELGSTDEALIDFGGGALDSAGQNCLAGGNLAALVVGYVVSARNNWWGTTGGPGVGRTAVTGKLDAGSPLPAEPVHCR